MLIDMQPYTAGLRELELKDDSPARDCGRLMQVLNVVNDRWRRGGMRMGSAKPPRAPQGSWETKLERHTLPTRQTERQCRLRGAEAGSESRAAGEEIGALKGVE